MTFKKVGEYVIRGQLTTSDTDQTRLQLFDGRFNTGYRIKTFEIGFSDRDNSSTVVGSAKLATTDGTDPRFWNWNAAEELAWAACTWDANNPNQPPPYSMIDPEAVVVEDLYVMCIAYSGQTVLLNYMIELEKLEFKDWDGAGILVQNNSQAGPQ